MNDDAPTFHNFLLNSTLSRAQMREFAIALSDAEPPGDDRPYFKYAAAPIEIVKKRDALQKIMDERASSREFDDRPLSVKEFGSLCSPLCATPSGGGRSWPSAGGRHPVETFVLPIRVDGIPRQVMYVDSAASSLTPVAPLPEWSEIATLVNPYPVTGVPAAVFLFVAMTLRTTQRYGERGGRFVLIEIGEAMQNLALRAAADGLAGVALGGVLDREAQSLVGLEGTDAAVCAAYACGRKPRKRH